MKNWIAAIAIIASCAILFWTMGQLQIEAQMAVAQAEVTAEEAAKREQAAYYKGWQDGKNYYLEKFGGIN